MIEMLGGMLPGIGFFGSPGYILGASGVVMIVLDIKRFIDIDVFISGVDLLIKTIKYSRKCPGVDDILIPGEFEFKNMRKKKEKGIELPPEVVDSIRNVASSLDINLDDYLK